tara:strand:- start:34837 stop:35490 length:654 start_codon:yes stop_codon:yes gene_type:complete
MEDISDKFAQIKSFPFGNILYKELHVRIGEVIQSSSVSFLAQGYDIKLPPSVGSIVIAGETLPSTVGVIQNVRVEPFDPTRPVIARGESLESEQDVFHESPQLLDLLTIRFECLIVAYQDEYGIKEGLALTPPMIHSFVNGAQPDTLKTVAKSPAFIRTVLDSKNVDSDSLLIASMRQLELELEAEVYRDIKAEVKNRLMAILARETPRLINILGYL